MSADQPISTPRAHSCDTPAAVLTRDAMDALAPGEEPGRQAMRLAERFGVRRQTVWSWRAGEKRPAPGHLLQLAELAGDRGRALEALG